MNDLTLCQSCGNEAIARVHSQWLCARCGLERTAAVAGMAGAGAGATSRTWRGAIKTALGSGLVAKMLVGAAAVAAVSSAVSADTPPTTTPPETVPVVSTPVGPPSDPVPGTLPPTADDQATDATTPGVVPAEQGNNPDDAMPPEVSAYVAAVNAWSACIDTAVHEFATAPGGGFDPFTACPDKPDAPGLYFGNPPGSAGRPDDPGSQGNGEGPPENPGEQGRGR